MKLRDLLARDRIVLDIPGDTVREAAHPLVDAAIAAGLADDPDRLDELLAESVPREAVTVGQQAFLLHFRTEAVREVVAVLGVASHPVHREHDPGKEARIVLLILAPPREASVYLRAVSAFARALAREEIAAAIEAATTPDDVLRIGQLASVDIPDELTVRDVLPPRRLSVRPEATLAEAAAMMVAHRVAAVPVVSEGDQVVGIVSHRELLEFLLPAYSKRMSGEFQAIRRGGRVPPADPRTMPVRDAMDRSVLCVTEEQTLGEVAALMVNKNLERVPVVREGALIGLLTRDEIVRRLFGP